jgi:hypothetical protein
MTMAKELKARETVGQGLECDRQFELFGLSVRPVTWNFLFVFSLLFPYSFFALFRS